MTEAYFEPGKDGNESFVFDTNTQRTEIEDHVTREEAPALEGQTEGAAKEVVVELSDTDRQAFSEAFSADANASLETFRDLAEQFPENTQGLTPAQASLLKRE
jgi:hypothetical protein